MKKFKKIPEFKNENEERKFWDTHDSTEYIDWSKAKRVVFPNLKPSTKTITIRVPQSLLNALKAVANKKDVPYQSLVKVYLDEKVREERKRRHEDESNEIEQDYRSQMSQADRSYLRGKGIIKR